MSKLDELQDIIWDYEILIEHWLSGNKASTYRTGDEKSANEFFDELRNRACELIEQLKAEEELNKAIESWH